MATKMMILPMLQPEKNKCPKVTFVISHLGLGGAERIMALMANYWSKKGWRITFMTLDHGKQPHFYSLEPSVRYIDFGWSEVRKRGIPKIRLLTTLISLRAALKKTKPDVIVSFLNTTNISVLMACFNLGIPVIVSERSDPHKDIIPPFWEYLRRMFYPTASRVVVQTHQALKYFSGRIQERCTVIPNPVMISPVVSSKGKKDKTEKDVYEIIAVGRLANQKGFDLLLHAFAIISPRHPEWRLTIWGEGPERNNLEKLIMDLGLSHSVKLPGKNQDIFHVLQKADLFVLSSRYEGFPNALCEAMTCGLPVISFDCPSGPAEIIRNGIDGLLAPPCDTDALAVCMERLINNAELRSYLALNARKIILRFNLDKILSIWEQVIQKSMGKQ